ncbi:MAG TPA: BREX system P-loop protein BrxC, partial [Gemmataceae bacterium]|nr:BREX system P-loop protein BrxC [Gemmataceae bacterium]
MSKRASFPDGLGFRDGTASVHTSRTMMLEELTLLLEQVSSDAPAAAYEAAIVEENVCGKPTQTTRQRTAKRLTELYALDPSTTVFRLLRYFWPAEPASRPMLAFLAGKGKLPCTLIVLDEVQQYIAESVDRSKAVQEVQQVCCARLGPQFMLFGTGQNALSGTPLLLRLQGRFPVTVELQDTDVEQVTREVVLKKRPSAEAAVKKVLDDHSGEIERQLANTKIAFATRDRNLLVQDYPILPVRRRFWERVLRAVDKAGTGAQLRTQLWIVYDAVQKTADLCLGNVVGGAFLFEHIKTRVLQSGVLLQEISETIARQKQEEDGELRYQLCALIFLIGQLPHQGPADAGVRANAESLADLLVTDLTRSSVELRKKVPDLLGKLVASGAVMQVEDEYRMQTREGSEWNQACQEARNKLLNDPGKLGSERSQLLKTHCSDILKKSKLLHGASKEARKFDLHFGAEPPPTGGSTVPVWIRDGWEVEDKTVLAEARAAGDSVAVVYGFVPRNHAEDLKQTVAGYYAATATLQAKGTPSTPEGIEARKAMETRQEQAQRARDNVLNDILNDTAIYLAGGEPVNGILLEMKVQDAAKACLDRPFPLFHQADVSAADWKRVIDRSRTGDGDALAAVGHAGDPESHPVCNAVINYVSSGKKGTDIRKYFARPPCGWPQDAVDAALIVLSNAGVLQARTGTESIPKGKLDQKNAAAAEFRVETITLTKVQLIETRTLFKKLGLNTQIGQESADAPKFIERMMQLAEGAGGDSPLPKLPDTSHLTDSANRVGNDQLKVIHENKDRLGQEVADWQRRKEGIAKR